jgi:hypothetical protein
MITQFLIPDWVKDLIRLIEEFLACLGSVFGVVLTIADIHSNAELLLEAMRDRIRYYPAAPCFIPEAPFTPPPEEIPGDNMPGEPIDDEDWGDFEDGDVYYPPIDKGGNTDRDFEGGVNIGLPIVIHPPVEVVHGIQGKKYPGFKLICDYLVL